MQFLSKSCTKRIYKINAIISFMVVSFLYTNSIETAHAGLFSLISDLGGDKVSAKNIESTSVANSQNMILLEAALNTDPNPHKNTEDNFLAYGNALSAEIGPQGTVSDIENKVSGEISLYTVREGDTLSKIAEMFDVSINTIIWANELGNNPKIKEGQMLVILPISGVKYTVKKGDTIKGIVLRYKANLEEVLQYNDLSLASVLNPGDVIVIPDAEPTYIESTKLSNIKASVKTHDAGGPFYPGYYIRPIVGGTKSQGLHGHNGVDIAAPVGTVIRASAAGRVISSISNGGWNGGYGNYIVISHDNGTQTLYSHNQKNFVKVGDNVEQGQMIAKVGMTGKTTGPHVHFEIRGAKNPF